MDFSERCQHGPASASGCRIGLTNPKGGLRESRWGRTTCWKIA
jgi:hypothetical protein